MADELVLRSARAIVGVLPAGGAAMSRYDYVAGGVTRSLLSNPDGPVNLVLAPWQNRVSHGGFTFDGRQVALAPTVPDRFPLHGTAWRLPWRVTDHASDRVTLTLEAHDPAPYRYKAVMRYRLEADGTLDTLVTVTNLGPRFPFGLGFHPYFTRTPGVHLKAGASTVILQDPAYMPTDAIGIDAIPRWDFRRGRALPDGWINNEFGGWDSRAEISWPEWGVACTLEAPGTQRYLVYSPTSDAPFFCFEPITHTIDAFNLPDPLGAGGLVALGGGEAMSLRLIFRPHML